MPNYTGKGKENLGQYSLPREVYLENCRRGGRLGAEKQKAKKQMREIANVILELVMADEEDIKLALKESGYSDDATVAAGILFAQARKAMHGDTEAARFVRDTAGQRPVDGLLVGRIEDKPFETIDLAELSDDDLKRLAAAKEEEALPEAIEE